MRTPQIKIEEHIQKQWTEEETANAKVVADFFQKLMNEHDFDTTLKKHGGGSYTQHNRAIPNEIPGLISYVKTMTKRFPEYSFDVKKVYADGDYILLHSHCTMRAKHRGDETKGFIITDTFKLKEGRVVEHWDAIQAVDFFSRFLMLITGGSIQNSNPTF